MRVSFNGIKNIGYTQFSYKTENQENTNSPVTPDEDYENHFLSLRLTDDKDGKDLSEYLTLIKNKPQFLNLYSNSTLILNINKRYESFENSDIYYPEYDFQINGEELELNDNNLKMFSFVSKLLNKTKEITNNSHSKNIKDTDVFVESNASQGSETMLNYIQNVMGNYFNK